MLDRTSRPKYRDNDVDDVIYEGRIRFDEDLARFTLEKLNYAKNRRIEQGHVDSLASMMRSHIMLPGSQIAFGRLNGELHLANGQHRLAAVMQCGIAQDFQVLIVECRDERDLKELYWRFDAVMRVRSTEQLLAAADIATDQNVTRSMAKAVYSAIGFILNDMKTPIGSHAINAVERRVLDFRLEACRSYWPHARTYQKSVDGAATQLKRKLLSGAVCSVALTTIRHQRERGCLFWDGVGANDGLRKGDPRHTLVQALLTTTEKGNGDMLVGSCAAAWNAWMAGRSLSIIRPITPVRLKGTPVGGKAAA